MMGELQQMKAILVIDMPNSCDECEVRCGGYTAKEYAEKDIKRPSWCPLRLLPQKKEIRNAIQYRGLAEEYRKEGWNDCLDAITGETE